MVSVGIDVTFVGKPLVSLRCATNPQRWMESYHSNINRQRLWLIWNRMSSMSHSIVKHWISLMCATDPQSSMDQYYSNVNRYQFISKPFVSLRWATDSQRWTNLYNSNRRCWVDFPLTEESMSNNLIILTERDFNSYESSNRKDKELIKEHGENETRKSNSCFTPLRRTCTVHTSPGGMFIQRYI